MYATVVGGLNNEAQGAYSLAMGRRAKANHDGAFVWADSTNADFSSTADNQFSVRARGGVRFDALNFTVNDADGNERFFVGSVTRVRFPGDYFRVINGDSEVVFEVTRASDNLLRVNPYHAFKLLDENDNTIFSVYHDGSVHWAAQTSYVSIPAAAFQPIDEVIDFYNNGAAVRLEENTSRAFVAPVQLPHNARVTKMTFYWYDVSSDEDGIVYLRRADLMGSWAFMASASTSGDSGVGSTEEDDVLRRIVDNSQYAYYLYLYLPNTDVECYGVVIEYTHTGPH